MPVTIPGNVALDNVTVDMGTERVEEGSAQEEAGATNYPAKPVARKVVKEVRAAGGWARQRFATMLTAMRCIEALPGPSALSSWVTSGR